MKTNCLVHVVHVLSCLTEWVMRVLHPRDVLSFRCIFLSMFTYNTISDNLPLCLFSFGDFLPSCTFSTFFSCSACSSFEFSFSLDFSIEFLLGVFFLVVCVACWEVLLVCVSWDICVTVLGDGVLCLDSPAPGIGGVIFWGNDCAPGIWGVDGIWGSGYLCDGGGNPTG